jgi:hypothetical protein
MATRTTVVRTEGRIGGQHGGLASHRRKHCLDPDTSIIAAGASIVYWANKRSRRTRLVNYLKAKEDKFPDEPFSVTRLMADLGMTETEIFAASFASRHIAPGVRRDQATGFAVEVLFRYQDDPEDRAPDEIVYQGGLRDLDEHAQFRRK